MHRVKQNADNITEASDTTSTGTLSNLRYGNIAYDVLQDIELAVITLKELKYMLSTHYRCYFNKTTTIGSQILEFSQTQYHSNVIESDVKGRLCQVMKGLLFERNKIVHDEGWDFLSDRQRFINQSMETFIRLSPTKEGGKVSPARYSVLIPSPDADALLEDFTFIDYNQYEDISIAIKVSKRLESILKDVFHQNGHDLHSIIQNFPYDVNNIKRKMSQANAIRNNLVHERFINNFENRIEYINLSRSIFANLLAIIEIESNRGAKFGGLHVDELSNTTDMNDVTTNLSDSTYQFSIHRPYVESKPSPFSSQWTNNYDKIPSFSTLPADAEDCNNRDKRQNPPNQNFRDVPLETIRPAPARKSARYVKINIKKEQHKRDRQARRNDKLCSVCKHTAIALLIVAVIVFLGFLGLKYLLKLF